MDKGPSERLYGELWLSAEDLRVRGYNDKTRQWETYEETEDPELKRLLRFTGIIEGETNGTKNNG